MGQSNVLKKDLVFLTLILGFLFGFMLGERPLSVPDEGRYAEIPREMVVSGDYITPRLNGVKYFEKPALMYWLEAVPIKLFGHSEWSLRLLPALLALMGCLATYLAGAILFGRIEGIMAALTLGTSILYYALSRLLALDIGVGVFLTIALLSYLLATRSNSPKHQNIFLALFFVGAALATLAKGLIGMVIPGTVILLWTLPYKRWSELALAFKWWGIALFFVIVAPWHIAVALKNPEFAHFYFIHEHFTRFLTTEHNRFQPIWFFIPIILVGWFPWISFMPQAIRNAMRLPEDQKAISQFLLIWAGFVFVFFSLSNSKLIPYILPAFPPLALLLGRYLADAGILHQSEESHSPVIPAKAGIHKLRWIPAFAGMTAKVDGFKCGVLSFAIFSSALAAGIPIALYTKGLSQAMELRPYVIGVIVALLLGAIITLIIRTKRPSAVLLSMGITNALVLMVLNSAWPVIERRSVKPLALEIKARIQPRDHVASFVQYYQDLPFYLNQTVKVVGWKGELEFGTIHEDTSDWMMEPQAFWELWKGPETVYMIMRKDAYEQLRGQEIQNLYPISSTEKDILVRNKDIG